MVSRPRLPARRPIATFCHHIDEQYQFTRRSVLLLLASERPCLIQFQAVHSNAKRRTDTRLPLLWQTACQGVYYERSLLWGPETQVDDQGLLSCQRQWPRWLDGWKRSDSNRRAPPGFGQPKVCYASARFRGMSELLVAPVLYHTPSHARTVPRPRARQSSTSSPCRRGYAAGDRTA